MHPTLKRMINRMGIASDAKTSKGILKAVKKFGLPPKIKTKAVHSRILCSRAVSDEKLQERAKERCFEMNPRKKNIWGTRAKKHVNGGFGWDYETINYRGSWKGWKDTAYNPTYQSRVDATSRSLTLVQLNKEVRKLVIRGRKYRFGNDANGLKIYDVARPDSDYHMTNEDILRGNVRKWVGKLRANAKARAKTLREEKKFTARLHKVFVGFWDSVSSGNCQSGTSTWASTVGLDVRRCYPATRVMELGQGQKRVKLACLAAARHQMQLERQGAVIFTPKGND